MPYLYFDDDMSAGDVAAEHEWQEIEAMSRAEIIEELCDILAQNQLREDKKISQMTIALEWSNGGIDELACLLSREETSEPSRIETILEVLRKK